jgi:plastocyanin
VTWGRHARRGAACAALALSATFALAVSAQAKPFHATIKQGPFVLKRYSVRLGTTVGIRTPRINGFITQMAADVVDVDTGKVVPIRRIMLHHIVFANLGHDGSKPGAEPFYGDGEERAMMDLPSGYGYPIQAADRWAMVWMLMNHRDRSDRVYIRYRMTLDRNPRLKPVVPLAWDASHGRQGLVFDVPGGGPPGSVSVRRASRTMPVSGRLVAGLGHVHGGAKSLSLSEPSCGNRAIYVSSPTWGLQSNPFYQVRPVLHEPGPINMSRFKSARGIPVAAGQKITLTSRYDGQYPHVRAMGLLLAYLAPDRSVTAQCGRMPNDIQIVRTTAPGRAVAPHVAIPTYTYGARGQAVRASGPSGPFSFSDGDANVAVADNSFTAGNLSVPVGGRVTWTFASSNIHNVTLAQGPDGFSSNRLKGGQTFTKQFTRPGTYRFFCELHPVGMVQRIVVRPR